MSGINIKYCVDGFNNFPCFNPKDAGHFAKVADYCYFYEISNGDLYDVKNLWETEEYFDNPIQVAIKRCSVFFAYDDNSFTIIKQRSLNLDLFNYIDKHFARRGWYFYNYMVSTDKFNDDCFLPLEGNEELFEKQYSIDIEELYKIASI